MGYIFGSFSFFTAVGGENLRFGKQL